MGGIVDVGLRDPKTDGLHGLVDINIVDSSFLLEGPITRNWSFAVAAKRSYFDLFIDKLVPKDNAQLTAAPVYWDYQAMLAYKPSSADRFRAMVYGSYDDVKLLLAHPADADPSLRGGLGQKTAFHRAQLTWQHKYNAAIEHQIDISAGPFVFDVDVGPDVKLQIPGYEGFLRSEWRARVTDQLRLIGGLDIAYNWFDFSFNGPPAGQVDGNPNASGPLTGQQTVELHDQFGLLRPAAYLEAVWQPAPRLTLVPGARVDYLSDVKAGPSIPRLTARYQVSATTTLKGGVGLFSQAPSGSESLPVARQPAPPAGAGSALQPRRRARDRHPTEGHRRRVLQAPRPRDRQQPRAGREPEQRRRRPDLRSRGLGEAPADCEVQRVPLVHPVAQRAPRPRTRMAPLQLGSDAHPDDRGSLSPWPRAGICRRRSAT